jgi:hypothetical protein
LAADNDLNQTMEESDFEFTGRFRASVDRYLRAVDAWEADYQKFYRLAGSHRRITPDMEKAQREYIFARRELEQCIPRARRLCLKFELRDPWAGLLRVELGTRAPQVQGGSAVGRNERMTIATCLRDMEDRTRTAPVDTTQPEARRGWLRRIIDYFM